MCRLWLVHPSLASAPSVPCVLVRGETPGGTLADGETSQKRDTYLAGEGGGTQAS